MEIDQINYFIDPEMPRRRDFRIGCIGAGFIMRDCHLVAYKDAGFNPYAITSLSLTESTQRLSLKLLSFGEASSRF